MEPEQVHTYTFHSPRICECFKGPGKLGLDTENWLADFKQYLSAFFHWFTPVVSTCLWCELAANILVDELITRWCSDGCSRNKIRQIDRSVWLREVNFKRCYRTLKEIKCDILIHPGNSFQGLSSATQEIDTTPCEQHSQSKPALPSSPE